MSTYTYKVQQKSGLNRSILDQNWGTFIAQLDNKAASAGGQLVRVDPNTPRNGVPVAGDYRSRH